MDRIEQMLDSLKINVNYQVPEVKHEILNNSFDRMQAIKDKPGTYCNVKELAEIFSWKKGFSYLFTGSPNAGKTTFAIYLFLLMSIKNGWKWCIWSPEMEDHEKTLGFLQKDLVYTLIWTLTGQTPYEFYAKAHNTPMLTIEEIKTAAGWVNDHFKFIHLNSRTPDAIIEAFNDCHKKYNVDGFLIDPWKSVKQVMDARADLWMEDTLMTFKEFSQESETVLNYVVHPKSLKDYTDEDGNYRVITPFDLNGGAAWFNSMDVIISIRRLTDHTEWYSQKIRKQHLVGRLGDFKSISFAMDKYRYYFAGSDPLEIKQNRYEKTPF
jgi:hypothetical protein